MNNTLLFCFTALLVIVLAGCDTSRYPIDDPPVVKIDTRLLGSWTLGKKKDDLIDRITVKRQNDYQYMISIKEKGSKKTENHVAFLSKVNNACFINVYSKGDTTDGYLILRLMEINANGNKITTATVSDSMLQYLTSAAEVKDYVARNIENPAFYKDTGYLYKVK